MSDRPRVLIVEDQPAARAALRELLGPGPGGWGFDVVAVASIGEALVALSRESFDVAVIDYRLGDVDHTGDRVAKEIRLGWPRCAVVIWTGFADQRLRDDMAIWSVQVVDKGDFARLRGEVERAMTTGERATRKLIAQLGYPVGARDAGDAVVGNVAACIVDREFGLRWLNPLCADLLGYDYDSTPEPELYAIDLSQHVPEEYREVHRQWVRDVFDAGESRVMARREVNLVRSNGDLVPVEIALIATPVLDAALYVTALIFEGRHDAAAAKQRRPSADG